MIEMLDADDRLDFAEPRRYAGRICARRLRAAAAVAVV
jgi:hypothetical protein